MRSYFIILLIVLVFAGKSTYAQFPDTDPGAWTLIWEDEFNYPTLSDFSSIQVDNYNDPRLPQYWQRNAWGVTYHTDHLLSPLELLTDNNITVHPDSDPAKGYITIQVKHETNTFNSETFYYTSTELFNANERGWKYGYYEISFRISDPVPQPFESDVKINGIWHYKTNLWGLSSAFWMDGADHTNGVYWSEIDLAEIFDGYNTVVPNMHFTDYDHLTGHDPGVAGQSSYYDAGNTKYGMSPKLRVKGKFHTLGFEWTPYYINYYLDHKLFRTSFDYSDKLVKMGWILGAAMNAYTSSGYYVNPHSGFPYNLDINYVKVYRPKMDCSQPYVVDYLNPSTYDHKTKKLIRVRGTSGSTVAAGQKVNLNAVQSIVIYKKFTVQKGAVFSATTRPCY